MKYLKIILPTLLILAGLIWGYGKLQANKEIIDQEASKTEVRIAKIPVTTVLVAEETIKNDLELIGTFEARKELSIIAESQGRITRLNIKEGQYVRKGQAIASIDNTTMQSQLATAKATLQKAKKDVERFENLLSKGAISQTQYEEVKLSMQNQESNLTSIEQQLKYASAKSPMSGIIKEIKLGEGSFATPGTEIATVVDISQLNLIVKMDEKDVVKVKNDQKVKIITEVYPDVTFIGKINQISVQADAVRKYGVEIQLKNTKANPLKAGMYGYVTIPSTLNGGEQKSLTIPRKSVVGSVKKPQVYLAKNGKAILTDIAIGETVGENVIVQDGLVVGDRVITTGQINLDNGRDISIIAAQSSNITINQ